LSDLGLAAAEGEATAAQIALNTAIEAFPLGWILAGIAAVVAAIKII